MHLQCGRRDRQVVLRRGRRAPRVIPPLRPVGGRCRRRGGANGIREHRRCNDHSPHATGLSAHHALSFGLDRVDVVRHERVFARRTARGACLLLRARTGVNGYHYGGNPKRVNGNRGSSGGSVGLEVPRGVPVPVLCSRLRRSPCAARSCARVGNRETAERRHPGKSKRTRGIGRACQVCAYGHFPPDAWPATEVVPAAGG